MTVRRSYQLAALDLYPQSGVLAALVFGEHRLSLALDWLVATGGEEAALAFRAHARQHRNSEAAQ